jgi:Skp family chaperone for outer membrane proteins
MYCFTNEVISMKKFVMGSLVAVACVSAAFAGSEVYIDSQELFKNSKEGKSLAVQNNKDKESLFSEEYQQNQKLSSMKEEIEKAMGKGILSEDDLQGKYAEFAKMQRSAKRAVEDVKEDIEMNTQARMMKFRNKVFAVAKGVAKKEGWSAVKDSNAPGMICVDESVNKTSKVLVALNEEYGKEKAQSSLTKKKA